MISYIKGLFSKKEDATEVEEVVVETPKDISEPVISFVECVKNNPRRFRLKVEYSVSHWAGWYLITDKVENITWKVKVISSGYGKDKYSCDTYFTPDEKELLRGVFTDYFGNQAKMKRDLRLKRGMAKRDRLKSIYCKENL
jgi:hypothetical protein